MLEIRLSPAAAYPTTQWLVCQARHCRILRTSPRAGFAVGRLQWRTASFPSFPLPTPRTGTLAPPAPAATRQPAQPHFRTYRRPLQSTLQSRIASVSEPKLQCGGCYERAGLRLSWNRRRAVRKQVSRQCGSK